MEELDERVRPVPLERLPEDAWQLGTELADLVHLRAAGVTVSDLVVVPAAAEERFYRLNNLPERLLQAFGSVRLDDPDEDDVEEAVPAARALVSGSFLLDEFIDAFYEATATLPDRVRVRRPGAVGETAARGRSTLLSYKHTLTADWSFEAVLERLGSARTIGLEARPVLLHGADEGPARADLERRAASALGWPVRLGVDASGAVSRVTRMSEPTVEASGATNAPGPRGGR